MSAARACSALRNYIAEVLGVGRDKVRVLTGQVGGSFGMKQPTYPRILLHPARGARTRPAGQMDRRALGQLPVRQPRPRPRDDRRAGARRGRQFPRGARDRLRQSRRHLWRARAGDPQRRRNTLGVYTTPLIEVHRPNACSPTPRRSAPIAAPAGPRAITTWSGWSTPPRPKWASTASNCAGATTSRREAMPYKSPNGAHLRQRRVHRAAGQGAGARRLGRVCRAPGREPGARQAARPRHRRLSRSDRRRPAARWAASASRPTAR